MINMINNIILLLFIVPFNVYGVGCWCQRGPDSYQELVDSEYGSVYTNCYLTGNNPSSDTCHGATCPGGDWVLGNTYAIGEISVSAIDGYDCIVKCMGMGNGYNIANMYGGCGDGDDDYYAANDNDNANDNYDDDDGSCTILTCPGIWNGQCGIFNNPSDKWCDAYGNSDAHICCAADASECCELDGGAIGGIIVGGLAFIGICFWYCRRQRDNTNDTPPNYAYKFFCPPCAVFGYQGCESKTDGCMTCCLCSFFTLFCWEPKRVYVGDNNVNVDNSYEIPHVTATVISKDNTVISKDNTQNI